MLLNKVQFFIPWTNVLAGKYLDFFFKVSC